MGGEGEGEGRHEDGEDEEDGGMDGDVSGLNNKNGRKKIKVAVWRMVARDQMRSGADAKAWRFMTI